MISESRACSIPNQLDITKRTLRYLAGSLASQWGDGHCSRPQAGGAAGLLDLEFQAGEDSSVTLAAAQDPTIRRPSRSPSSPRPNGDCSTTSRMSATCLRSSEGVRCSAMPKSGPRKGFESRSAIAASRRADGPWSSQSVPRGYQPTTYRSISLPGPRCCTSFTRAGFLNIRKVNIPSCISLQTLR